MRGFSGCSVHMRKNEGVQGKWYNPVAVVWLLTAAIRLKKWAWPSHYRGLENNYICENIFVCSHIMAIKKPYWKGNVNSRKMWKTHREKLNRFKGQWFYLRRSWYFLTVKFCSTCVVFNIIEWECRNVFKIQLRKIWRYFSTCNIKETS